MKVDSDLFVTMSDGVRVALRVYRPDAPGHYPALFAASPYRYDNDDVPETGAFLWHEIGPLRWYVEQGYAYVRLDIRGTGRSGGDYNFYDRRERRDLHEVIEWIAAQSWSNGRVGGFGQSYYARAQWCMAAERPPHLTCIAPYDGHTDLFGGWCYQGGIPSAFMSTWWNSIVRPINQNPANGAPPRAIACDLPWIISQHPSFDDFWREREIEDALTRVDIPVYSIGVWAKRDLHLNGNIIGYQKVRGPKKLRLSGAPSPGAAHKEFASQQFHETVLLPFYDHYLKGLDTPYLKRPAVEYAVRGGDALATAAEWPPQHMRYEAWYLGAERSGSVRSLNDGSLSQTAGSADGATSYRQPDASWTIGHVAMTPQGPDPVARVLTFTSAPLPEDVIIAGPAELVLYLSADRGDTDVIVRLSEQAAQDSKTADTKAAQAQPASTLVTKGWLRASHRAVDAEASRPGTPVLTHADPAPLQPGEVYELRIPLMPAAYRFRAGSRIRLEIAGTDSPLTDAQWWHVYTPDRAGTDTIHHSAAAPSHLLLPRLRG